MKWKFTYASSRLSRLPAKSGRILSSKYLYTTASIEGRARRTRKVFRLSPSGKKRASTCTNPRTSSLCAPSSDAIEKRFHFLGAGASDASGGATKGGGAGSGSSAIGGGA